MESDTVLKVKPITAMGYYNPTFSRTKRVGCTITRPYSIFVSYCRFSSHPRHARRINQGQRNFTAVASQILH